MFWGQKNILFTKKKIIYFSFKIFISIHYINTKSGICCLNKYIIGKFLMKKGFQKGRRNMRRISDEITAKFLFVIKKGKNLG